MCFGKWKILKLREIGGGVGRHCENRLGGGRKVQLTPVSLNLLAVGTLVGQGTTVQHKAMVVARRENPTVNINAGQFVRCTKMFS